MERSESEQPEKKKSNRQKSTYKGTMKKSGSKKNPIIEESPKRFTRGDAKRQAELENVNPQNEAEDDEDVKSISSDDVIVETKKKGRKSKGKKEGEKMKKAEEETQVESEEDVLYDGSNSDDERLPVGKEKKKKKRTKKAKSSTSRSYLIKQSKNDIEGGENNETEEEDEDRKLTKDKMHKGLESESEGDGQKVTIPKKGKGSKAEKPYPTCNIRSSPKPMYEAMMTLSHLQKKCLKDMGFERMIHFPIVELPSTLAYHEIDHFHTGSMELRLEKGSIKATRQKVQDMLGYQWGAGTIASVISDTTEADFMFRMNFITLFGSTMGTLDNGGRVSTKLLKRITEDVDISDIDWCGYILDCLHTSKKNWKDVKTRKNFYYGPLTFLCLLYLDSTIFPDLLVLRHRPTLRSWNTTTMRKRIKMETETRRLGKLEHHEEFDPEEEQDGMNVYKGLDVYVALINDKEPETKEEYYEKIILKFDMISDERSELVRTLRNAVKKFKDDQMMIDFCKQYGELFNDNEFNLYESSKDNDSEGEPEESGSEGTEESGSEGTEENGSESTEGGSDGKEENMNGDEREMNNNDMKNDSVQEKQDTDKDENAKVDNVKEKQGDHKDEIGEDEFWNTQFTDSQCEEMENQAKEEIKKKKTAKRKSTKEMTPPSFSLALSPDTNKTLAPTLKIESNVIDTYCLVLNHEQGVNSKGKKTKHFFHTGMITKDMFNWKMEDGKKYDEVKQYKAFSDTMKNEFKKEEVKKLKDLEMEFFPIIAHEHYYLVVFNFLKGTTVIIDNSKTPMSYEAKYKKVCDVLKNMFSMHLKEVQYPRAKEVLNKKPTILRPKWGTEENNTDCGVFLMMHMENYNGENARNWNLEFETEKEGNRYDIIKMRMRFAIKILSHEINIHREEMSKQALEFADRNKEKKAREVLIREAIRVKKERKESERVQSVI
ncbi:ulp1 protease family, C-terminal catalytic domain-containing protein [Tanacetum coccineum]